MARLRVSDTVVETMFHALEQAEAAYEMLIQSASGQNDFTEEQITNVLDGVRAQCAQAMAMARGRATPAPVRRAHIHGPVTGQRFLHS